MVSAADNGTCNGLAQPAVGVVAAFCSGCSNPESFPRFGPIFCRHHQGKHRQPELGKGDGVTAGLSTAILFYRTFPVSSVHSSFAVLMRSLGIRRLELFYFPVISFYPFPFFRAPPRERGGSGFQCLSSRHKYRTEILLHYQRLTYSGKWRTSLVSLRRVKESPW